MQTDCVNRTVTTTQFGEQEEVTKPTPMALGETKVLLVEDDAVDAMLVRRLLNGNFKVNYVVTHVSSISETLECLSDAETPFDVVLLDLNLPDALELDGLARTFDKLSGSTPVIVLSGVADEAVALEAINREAQDYISKHRMNGPDLDRSIQYAVERHQIQAELRQRRERFRQFARVSSDRFWEMDGDFKFVEAPDTLIDAEAPEADDIVGLAPWEITGYEPLHDETWEYHRSDLESHLPFRDFDILYTDNQDRQTYWSVSGEPFYAPDGEFLGYRGTASNITV